MREWRRADSPTWKQKVLEDRVPHDSSKKVGLTPIEGVKINGVIKMPHPEEDTKDDAKEESVEEKQHCIMPLFRVSVCGRGSAQSHSDS